MGNVIKMKRAAVPGVAPAPHQLVLGELAVNTADGVAFLKKSDGTVVVVGNAPGTIPFDLAGTCLHHHGGLLLFRCVLARPVTFPAGLAGSFGVRDRPSRKAVVLDLRRNGTGFGSITFARRSITASFASWSNMTCAAGDVLTVTALSRRDAERADGATFTLAGVR
ncbi:MAG: hypothetical protein H7840_18165 [Alphaproteobacteria bacterium]